VNYRQKVNTYFFFFLRFDFPALLKAIATACFWDFPAFISCRMLYEIVFRELPRFSGITHPF